ncbi:disease resistance protein [Trifolium medium]|uniref:Disease resistance protein n=1 Tax=Trifolium medium TaxID=97028 RepID=A0A392LYF0_9FABA|nr:disease resistance protein [Trifolium medium]
MNIRSDLGESKQQDSNVNQEETEEAKEQRKKEEIAGRNPEEKWKKLDRGSYNVKTDIVGFKEESRKIIDWLTDGRRADCNVMVLVGMAGQGKTTLAKKIFDNKEVIKKFNCSAWINVSDFNDPKEFFRFMLKQLINEEKELISTPFDYSDMDLVSLKNEVIKYLHKRYILFFDDVWSINFWKEIEQTVSSNNEDGCRIIITTRNKEVAYTCYTWDKSRTTDVEVQPLSDEESLKLFCQIANDDKTHYPEQYAEISSEIVEIFEGLPFGIAAIGKLLSGPRINPYEWKSELQKANITKIMCLGYDNLPDHLKPCLLYFGIYPQGYSVKIKRLIRQWIAEGFVRYEMGRRAEEVAEGFVRYEMGRCAEEVAEDYLTSLINRNLVLVSSFTVDDKPKSCRIHCLIHDMILRQFEDLYFCRCINENNRADVSGVTRRLSIATNSTEALTGFFDDLLVDIESLYIRSLLFFTKEQLPEDFARQIPSKYKQLKVLDFENSQLLYNLDQCLGGLIHLKYLSFRNTKIESLPKSIGKLQNLETLDVRQTDVNEMPKEVAKLRKLRHFLGLVQMKVGMGGMRSLQTLRSVELDDNVGLIEKELEKLWQIKDLGLKNYYVTENDAKAICSAINKMRHLEKLHITAKENEMIDLKHMKKPSVLKKLCLQGMLHKLPEWVPNHVRFVKLVLSGSKLTNESDTLGPLKNLPSLLALSIIDDAYVGNSLDFNDGDFECLKELELGSLHSLSSITVDSNALPLLKKLHLRDIPQLKSVPFSIQHLKNLEHLNYRNMSAEFHQILMPIITKHLPHVRINGVLGSSMKD